MPGLRSALVVGGVEVGRQYEGHLTGGRDHAIHLAGETLRVSGVHGLQLRGSWGHGWVHVVRQQ